MRIVGGRLRGRRLLAPESRAVRPTTDRAREAIFNVVESRFRDRLQGGQVADFYAGTGALGIEALSRGAAFAAFIERAPEALTLLKANIAALGLQAATRDESADAATAAERLGPFDLVFADPPYGGPEAQRFLDGISTSGCISPDGVLILESGRDDVLSLATGLTLVVEKHYGDSHVSFFLRD
jgi:16S rRNA (guanine966-N2)-methyltransferase